MEQPSGLDSIAARLRLSPSDNRPLSSKSGHRTAMGRKTGPKAGPIAPGDEILLMSGNYGNLWISIWQAEIANSAFVTIQRRAGADARSDIAFRREHQRVGVQWAQGAKSPSPPLSAAAVPWSRSLTAERPFRHPTSCFENMTISSQDNVAGWSKAQWVANSAHRVFLPQHRGHDGYEVRFTDRFAHHQCHGPAV